MLNGLYQLKNMKIHDDFLPDDQFRYLTNYMYGPDFSWHYGIILDEELECDELDNIQFGHIFYSNFQPQSPGFSVIEPIIRSPELKVTSLFRVKANLNVRTPEIVRHGFHVDLPYKSTTAIYYVNTNDGYTEFEDGTKIESVENRLVTFDSSLKHTGTTCTDSKIRCVINFNYTSEL